MSAENNKGLGFIETLIAVIIFTQVFLSVVQFYNCRISADYSCKKIQEGTYYLETIKKQFQTNYKYEELATMSDKKLYIDKDELDDIDIFYDNILSHMKSTHGGSDYISFDVKESGNGTLEFIIEYCYSGGSIDCVFFKGNYEKV